MEDYNGDYYAWLTSTARALEEGRWSDIDAAQVAEELLDMSRSERRGIESHFRRILTHLLKIRYQPGRHSRSWDLSIEESRIRLEELFADNPSLMARADELLRTAYRSARVAAARQTKIATDVFPVDCPYSVADVLERDWSAPDPKSC
jgi:hypothetical protein